MSMLTLTSKTCFGAIRGCQEQICEACKLKQTISCQWGGVLQNQSKRPKHPHKQPFVFSCKVNSVILLFQKEKDEETPLCIYIYFFFLSLFQGHDSFFLKRQKSPPPKDYFFFVFDGKIVITLTKKNIQIILFLINFTMTNIYLGKDIFIPISGLIIFFLTRIKFYLHCFNVQFFVCLWLQ